MCGIVGYVGEKQCTDILVGALQKLEYRGYDSAGIALYKDGYKNWDGDISKLLVDDGRNVVVRAIDVGDPKDIVGPSVVVKTTGELGDRVMITINDETGPAIYTQIDPLTSDTGEYIFQSTNGTGGTQYYVLQYDEKEKNYKLVQYEHHKGFNSADRAGAKS